MGGNWTNNCSSHVPIKTMQYDLMIVSLIYLAPGNGSISFNDEQKAIIKSLNEVIPGFNQLHISNEQFCKN